MFLVRLAFLLSAVLYCLSPVELRAGEVPYELRDVSIQEHLGATVSIDSLNFRDDFGAVVPLSKYFRQGRPVLLTMIYYECPNLCNFLLNELTHALKSFDWTPGDRFDIVTVSINPKETPELAAKKKAAYVKAYGRLESSKGWHFMTGEESEIKKLASEVGFGYRYDEREKQYAHSAAVYVLTPEGKISRYLYGIDFRPKDLKLSLLEATNGKIGNVVDRFMLFCYHYDPKTRKYSMVLTRVMQAGGAGTVMVFGGFLAAFWRREKKKYAKGA